MAGFVLLTLGRCLVARVVRRGLRLLALLSRLLVGVILVPPRLGAPHLLSLVGLVLHRLLCLLRRLVFLRFRPRLL